MQQEQIPVHANFFQGMQISHVRLRRTLLPKIPLSPSEFCGLLPSTTLGEFQQCSVMSETEIGVVFFSNEMSTC